jgi:hypothetical protein
MIYRTLNAEGSSLEHMKITRRSLLKCSSGTLASLSLIALPRYLRAQGEEPPVLDIASLKVDPARRPFGRAILGNLIVREQPIISAGVVRRLKQNEVIPISGQVSTVGPQKHNPIWYQTKDGWVHSGNIQPAEQQLNTPITKIEGESIWGDVTMPVSVLHTLPSTEAPVRRNLFYGMVFRITGLAQDDKGQTWYRIADGNTGNIGFATAKHIRPLTAADFAPISPEVPLENKHIEVDLTKQIAIAFEDDKPVFTARVATGGRYRTPEGVHNFYTIPGEHRIFRKIAGQLMAGGTAGFDGYYLPGIGWVSYFTSSGIAFHATYWHNDYGAPRSHGCVNMLPEDAQWVFRWTMPGYPATEQRMLATTRDQGSHVKVF